jgi:hypothetical protein
MKIYIENGKINHNQQGIEVEVQDDFFSKYPMRIDIYSFEVVDGEVVCMNEEEVELLQIEETLKAALPRYNELKELGDLRSNSENEEFQIMEGKKKKLLERRKEILDNEI